jgi:hypothetical protein
MSHRVLEEGGSDCRRFISARKAHVILTRVTEIMRKLLHSRMLLLGALYIGTNVSETTVSPTFSVLEGSDIEAACTQRAYS